jgi:hypothetical protein
MLDRSTPRLGRSALAVGQLAPHELSVFVLAILLKPLLANAVDVLRAQQGCSQDLRAPWHPYLIGKRFGLGDRMRYARAEQQQRQSAAPAPGLHRWAATSDITLHTRFLRVSDFDARHLQAHVRLNGSGRDCLSKLAAAHGGCTRTSDPPESVHTVQLLGITEAHTHSAPSVSRGEAEFGCGVRDTFLA